MAVKSGNRANRLLNRSNRWPYKLLIARYGTKWSDINQNEPYIRAYGPVSHAQPGFLLLGLRNYKIRRELSKIATSQSDITHVISFG